MAAGRRRARGLALLRQPWTPQLLDEVFGLLDLAFPGAELPRKERDARRLGGRWDAISTPFVQRVDGALVSHVGVLSHRMAVNGRPFAVGGVHGVATHPERRRRGHYRAAMEEALAWADARWDALELSTAEPELYEPFGFRVLDEHRFVGRGRGGGRAGLRRLDYASPADVELLQGLLGRRAPVSHRLGVVEPGDVFLFVESWRPPLYADDLDAAFALEIEGTTVRLYDVVAPVIPPLASLWDRLPREIQRVEVYFAPDRLDAELNPEPHVLDGDDHFMVRGAFPVPDGPFMLPRSARH